MCSWQRTLPGCPPPKLTDYTTVDGVRGQQKHTTRTAWSSKLRTAIRLLYCNVTSFLRLTAGTSEEAQLLREIGKAGLRCFSTTFLRFVNLKGPRPQGEVCQQRSARRRCADCMKKEKREKSMGAKVRSKMTALRQRVGIHQPKPSTLPQAGTRTPRRDVCASGKKSICITMSYGCVLPQAQVALPFWTVQRKDAVLP